MAGLPALRLPRSVWNRIIDERLNYYADLILPMSEELVDYFPFATDLTAREKYDAYLAITVDLTDFELISDPAYELRVRNRVDRAPNSPRWKQMLMVPGEFSKASKEFRDLMERYSEAPT